MWRQLMIIVCCCLVHAWNGGVCGAGEKTPTTGPEELVTGIYHQVSKTERTLPDWGAVRANFHPHAVIVLRVSRDEPKLMSVDEFIRDFKDFYDRLGPQAQFTETVVAVEIMEYGNIARCEVVYEAAIGGSDRPPQRGLDSWQLMFREGRWWVVSVVNESEAVAGPIPRTAIGP